MASRLAVTAALKMFSLTFAGDVTAERITLYVAALDDVTDHQLERATVELVKCHRGEWIPTPATIRAAALPPRWEPAIDTEELLRHIDRLGTYLPAAGWQSPRVERVRAVMGDVIASAYADAGGPSRCFADDETTRRIALRDFQLALRQARKELGTGALVGTGEPLKLLRGDAA